MIHQTYKEVIKIGIIKKENIIAYTIKDPDHDPEIAIYCSECFETAKEKGELKLDSIFTQEDIEKSEDLIICDACDLIL